MTTWQKLQLHPEKIDFLRTRQRILTTIREFFMTEDFLEIDTPALVRCPGMEPYLDVFETQLLSSNGNGERAFLLTSPEYALKKLLVAGIPRLFQIGKSFRNGEGLSSKHNPEFTMMEWYRTQADYTHIMRDCEQLFVAIARTLHPRGADNTPVVITYQGKTYDLTPPWPRISVAEAFAHFAQIDTDTLLDKQLLKTAAAKKGYQVDDSTTWEQMYNQIFLNEVEPELGKERPTILYDYPASQASLARRKDTDPRFAERFEFYIAGMELGNAFSELTDADEQLKRFEAERAERKDLGKTLYDIDMDYIAALRTGLPPTGGIAVGIDRIVMLFADAPTIQDVLVFPASELWG